jgi:hypothetical protein
MPDVVCTFFDFDAHCLLFVAVIINEAKFNCGGIVCKKGEVHSVAVPIGA